MGLKYMVRMPWETFHDYDPSAPKTDKPVQNNVLAPHTPQTGAPAQRLRGQMSQFGLDEVYVKDLDRTVNPKNKGKKPAKRQTASPDREPYDEEVWDLDPSEWPTKYGPGVDFKRIDSYNAKGRVIKRIYRMKPDYFTDWEECSPRGGRKRTRC